MSVWCKRILLAVALVVLPMQGIAVGLSFLACHGDSDLHAVHNHDGHGNGSHEHDSHDHGNSTSDAPSHLCCHLTVSGIPAVTPTAFMPDPAALNSEPRLLHDLFLPDRPQRPPLA